MTKEHKAEVAKIVRKLRKFGMVVKQHSHRHAMYDAAFVIHPLRDWKRKTVQAARAFLNNGLCKYCKFARIASQQARRCTDLLESMDYKLRRSIGTTNFDYVKFVDEHSDRMVVFVFDGN